MITPTAAIASLLSQLYNSRSLLRLGLVTSQVDPSYLPVTTYECTDSPTSTAPCFSYYYWSNFPNFGAASTLFSIYDCSVIFTISIFVFLLQLHW